MNIIRNNLLFNHTYLTQLEQDASIDDAASAIAAGVHSLRKAGNDGSHLTQYKEAGTPGRAFLTLLETIYVAAEVYKRY